jgi:membrane protein
MRRIDFRALWTMARDALAAWSDDYASSMGAALAYYTIFSIAPLFVIVIAIAGVFFGADAAQNAIYSELRGLVGDGGATAIQAMVKGASNPAQSAFAALVGVIALMLGATSVFSELQSDLDRIWRAPAATRPSGVWSLVRARLLSFGMIVGIGFLLLVLLVVSAALAALARWWTPLLGNTGVLLHALDFIVSLTMVTGLFALIYKILPRVSIGWHDVWIGAAVTALLFTIGKLAIGFYIGRSALVSSFGAAGSVVLLLVWVYYSAQVFLLGAEFTWVYAHRYGSRVGCDVPVPETLPRRDSTPASAGKPASV